MRREREMYKNNEGYTDNTAGEAIERADRPPHAVRQVIYILRLIAAAIPPLTVLSLTTYSAFG